VNSVPYAALSVLLAACVAWVMEWVPWLPGPAGVLWNTPEQDVEVWLQRADDAAYVLKHRKAFKCLQQAVKVADTREPRFKAGLAMGRFLLERAAQRPQPYAMAAREYLKAALDLAETPEQKLGVCRELMVVARLTRDMPAVLETGALALQSAFGDNDRANMLLAQMDACLEFGTRTEMSGLFAAAEEVFENLPERRSELAAREAAAGRQFLMRSDWFEDYVGQEGLEAAVWLRVTLLNASKLHYRDLPTDEKTAEEALRLAHMCCRAGQFDDADYFLQEFLGHEPGKYLETALMLSIDIAREQGRAEDANRGIRSCLRRCGPTKRIADKALALVQSLEDSNRHQQALETVDMFLEHAAGTGEADPRLAAKGLLIAGRLVSFDKADDYVNALMTPDTPVDLLVATAEEYADICLQAHELTKAESLLTRCLALFPNHRSFHELAFGLFDIARLRNSSPGAVVLTGLAAAERKPGSDRAAEAVIVAAGTIEEAGIPLGADVLYRKAGLLDVREPGKEDAQSRIGGETLLGRARCLLAEGNPTRADRLLREAAGVAGTGETACEVGLLWSRIAEGRGQIREAQRRLAGGRPEAATPELSAAMDVQERLLALRSGKASAVAIDELLASIQCLDTRTYGDMARSAFVTLFDSLCADTDVDGMRRALEAAMSSPFAGDLPIRAFAWQIGLAILETQGVRGFTEWMEGECGTLLKEAQPAAGGIANTAQAGADALKELRDDLAKLL